MIVLPNGFNVFPEDIENALRVAGIRDSVAVETRPGRIEAWCSAPGTHADPREPAPRRRSRSCARRAARARSRRRSRKPTRRLGPNQRIAGWRLWPEADFPRTHTFKVKRDRVRTWATDEAPLPVTEGAAASG